MNFLQRTFASPVSTSTSSSSSEGDGSGFVSVALICPSNSKDEGVAVYFPGEPLRGFVSIEGGGTKSKSGFKCIELELRGSFTCKNAVLNPPDDDRDPSSSGTGATTGTSSFFGIGRRKDERLFTNKSFTILQETLVINPSSSESKKGQTEDEEEGRYPFTFQLSPNCPPTMEWTSTPLLPSVSSSPDDSPQLGQSQPSSPPQPSSSFFRIHYSVTARVRRDWSKSDKYCSVPFRMCLSPSSSPVKEKTMSQPQSQEEEADVIPYTPVEERTKPKPTISNFYSANLNRGSVRAHVTLERSLFSSGDHLPLSIKTFNQCPAKIHMRATLQQCLTWMEITTGPESVEHNKKKGDGVGPKGRRTTVVVDVARWNMSPVAPWEIKEWLKAEGLVIPTRLPPSSSSLLLPLSSSSPKSRKVGSPSEENDIFQITYRLKIRPIIESVDNQGWVASSYSVDSSKSLICDLKLIFPLTIIVSDNTVTSDLSPWNYDEEGAVGGCDDFASSAPPPSSSQPSSPTRRTSSNSLPPHVVIPNDQTEGQRQRQALYQTEDKPPSYDEAIGRK